MKKIVGVGIALAIIFFASYQGFRARVGSSSLIHHQRAVTTSERGVSSRAGDEYVYTNTHYDFAFRYASSFLVREFEDEGGAMIVLQARDGGLSGLQIYIKPLDQPVSFTPDFIKSDLPGIAIERAQKIVLDKEEGIMFESNNPSFGGRSFELWFAHEGLIYQVSSYLDSAQIVKSIMSTWSFLD